MKPPCFEYSRPTTLRGALESLAASAGRARILAGGQSLVPMMNFRIARPEALIDINRISELAYHRVEGGLLCIGALARHAELHGSDLVSASCPVMREAYAYVAHAAIRNRGTLCGNLCHADPASEMPAVMRAVGATMIAASRSGDRQISADDFFIGLYQTVLRPDELLREVRIPIADRTAGWGFHEVSIRRGDFALVAVAACLTMRSSRIRSVKIVLSGVGDRCRRLPEVETSLADQPSDSLVLRTAAELASRLVSPQSDTAADAEYRRDLVRALVNRTLSDAARRAAGQTVDPRI